MMRGFAATHTTVPVIVINTQDDPRARAFTLLHELAHLYLAALDVAPPRDVEAWADAFAGDVLMPRAWVHTLLSPLRGTRLEVVDALALRRGVTPLAAAVRLATAGLWSWNDTVPVLEQIQGRQPRQGGSGGDYYRTQIGRLSPTFTRLVFTALDSQAVTYPAASSLLDGVKVSNFDKLREYLAKRATQE
jgi:Zn-dependent peptidase ImmA (M78 family)